MKLNKYQIVFLMLLTIFLVTSAILYAQHVTQKSTNISQTSLIILGTIQDGGSPHAGCKKDCCRDLFEHPDVSRRVVSLGVIDPVNQKTYLFEATPNLPEQMKSLKKAVTFNEKETPDAIFVTHAHIGHYTGLMYLGKEAMDASQVPVYAMPRMKTFLEQNGPWSQLVNTKNILITDLSNQKKVILSKDLSVTPVLVPHRDEYSETVGFIIKGPNKKVLFIPDIDKWQKWDKNIIDMIKQVDYAFIDGTFYEGEEINNRDISEIPHPFIIESMELFKNLSPEEKGKVHLIHFNHTNPVLKPESKQAQQVKKIGFRLAHINDLFDL